MNKRRAGIAAAFTAIGIIELMALNLIFSPGYIWFYYAAFAALWWPLSELVPPRKYPSGFALAGSFLTVLFLAVVNLQNSPDHPWLLYAIFPLAWWPVGVFFSLRKRFRGLSLAGCVLTVAYFVALNFWLTPAYPWFLYACYPLIWWPIATHLGRKAGTLSFAVICSMITIAYYSALNLFLSPGYPWAIYPAYTVLWWPLSLYFSRKKQWLGYSLSASIMSVIFLIAVNWVSSPQAVWAIYPIFALLWWPLSLFFAQRRDWLGYSIAGALLFIVFMAAVNLLTSPGVSWALFPAFAVLWWPLSLFFARNKNWFALSLAATLLFCAFIATVNLVFSPGVLWAVYPIFASLWWPLSMYFFRYKKLRAGHRP